MASDGMVRIRWFKGELVVHCAPKDAHKVALEYILANADKFLSVTVLRPAEADAPKPMCAE